MRKVIFKIDDLEWFRQYYKLSEEQFSDIFSDQQPFKCIYILYGEGQQVDRYELTDYTGNNIYLNDLNGYQKGVILNDCYVYFTGGKYHSDTEGPCGVVDIKEEFI